VIGRIAESLGQLRLSLALYGRLLYLRARLRALGAAKVEGDGLPLPRARLLFLVTNECDPAWYLTSGAAAASSLVDLLARNDLDLADQAPILDFGCGCGRVVRRWQGLGVAVHGTDVNPHLVGWCRTNLRFGQFGVNRLEPPLAYADNAFGLIYAFSVFTHLPDELERWWITELRRVLRPGGHLVLSTHGEAYLERLDASERAAFQRGETVVRRGAVAGSNWCTSFHPERAIRERLARGFDVVDFVPYGAKGNPVQDISLLRKPV
jgi:SAM-dependent methyltransferase